MSAAAAARARLTPDEDSTMFFPGPVDDLDPGSIGGPIPDRDDLTTLADLGGLSPDLDAPASSFEPLDELGGESGPALLAAKAEPLGVDRRRPASAKSGRPSRSAQGAAAARSVKKRSPSRRKPKEPSKLLIGLGVLVVAMAGVGAAYYLTQRGSDDTTSSDQVATGDLGGTEAETGETETPTSPDEPAQEEETAGPSAGLPPVVIFDEAAIGPVDAGVPYQIAVGDGPANAEYQLYIDDVPDADPAPELPPVVFEPGRHLLVIAITNETESISTDPVVVYAVGETPGITYRANLSSVNIETEGWAEAVRQFDEFVGVGHDNLQLMPSEPFPSLVPGYWNLFVDGFDSAAGATDYCAEFDLAVPEDCFAQRFDPDAPASG